MSKNIVLSASRRTDIPAFYLDWFIESLKKETFEIEQPFTHEVKKVTIPKDSIHSIVFWSKNYEYLLNRIDELKEFNLYFHFTINSSDILLEPNVTTLNERLRQLERLVSLFGSEKIALRFDPVVFYNYMGVIYNNLKDFDIIAEKTSKIGLKFIITSFMSPYKKIDRRIKRIEGFNFIFPDLNQQIKILSDLAQKANEFGLNVHLCCQKELVNQGIPNTSKASCINVSMLTRLFGAGPLISPDKSQRISKGCGCQVSLDVGSYGLQPCKGKCLYCYR